MVAVELRLNLPDSVAREAEAQGLLRAEAIEALLRAELRRRHVDLLFDAADRLAALPEPLTDEEIEAEIQAVRGEEPHSHNRSPSPDGSVTGGQIVMVTSAPDTQRELRQNEA